MKAADTVENQKYSDFITCPCCGTHHAILYKHIREEQAEISFKAGIKKGVASQIKRMGGRMTTQQAKPRCPDARSTRAVDDEHDEIHEGPDWCKLVDKMCLLDQDMECYVYESWLAEQCTNDDWYMKQDEG